MFKVDPHLGLNCLILGLFLLLGSFFFLGSLPCGSGIDLFLRVWIDENFDLMLVFDMLMEIFDDFPIVVFILDEKLVDFQQLPVLRAIILDVVVRRNAFLSPVDWLYPLISYLFSLLLLHEFVDKWLVVVSSTLIDFFWVLGCALGRKGVFLTCLVSHWNYIYWETQVQITLIMMWNESSVVDWILRFLPGHTDTVAVSPVLYWLWKDVVRIGCIKVGLVQLALTLL